MKIDRLVSMIMILLEKGRIGAQELADMFEVSLRTIYRDIDAINMAGIPVHGTSGVGGGFEIMKEYKVDKNIFSAADLSAILMGLFGLSQIVRDNELKNTLVKVRSFIPADRVKDIEYRLFRLSRMSDLQMQEETFIPRNYQKPVLDFAEILETMQIKIKIRIHKSILDRVLDHCTYEHVSLDDDEHYIVNFPFIENEYYYNILFSFGDKCECLKPMHIRTEMKHRIHAWLPYIKTELRIRFSFILFRHLPKSVYSSCRRRLWQYPKPC